MTHNILWTTHLAASMMPKIDLRIFSRKLPQSRLISHHFTLEQVIQAYGSFEHDMKVEALKVIVTNEIMMEKSIQSDRKELIPFPVIALTDSFLDKGTENSIILTGDNSHATHRR